MTKLPQAQLVLPLLLLTLIGGFLLFYRLDALPLRLWDEGRRAVNALEMSQGMSSVLVPTFAGEPDHWGTKPPLLVWLQASCFRLLGPGVLAVRLPAALAALLTCWVLFAFTVRRFVAPWWGVAAGFSLLSVPVYLGSHAARSGDFDALLVLWTTVMALGTYSYLEERKPRQLLLVSLAFTLALWTKGIAAGFFLPGIMIWTLTYRPHRAVWKVWPVYPAILLPLLSLLGYYWAREMQDPGFLNVLWENEIGGRYGTALEGHTKTPWFYLRLLFFRPLEQAWVVLLPLAGLLLWRRLAYRRLVTYILVLVGSFLVVISSAGTKLFWYTMPLYPLFAILVGGAWYEVTTHLSERSGKLARVILVFGLLLFVWPLTRAWQRVSETEHGDDYRSITVYADYLAQLEPVPAYTVLLPSYNAHAVFAVALARRNGQEVALRYLRQPEPRVHPGIPPLTPFESGTEVVVCEMPTWLYMDSTYIFTEANAISPCKLLRVTASK